MPSAGVPSPTGYLLGAATKGLDALNANLEIDTDSLNYKVSAVLGSAAVIVASFFTGAGEAEVAENAVAKGGIYLLREAETSLMMRTGRSKNLIRKAAGHTRDPTLKDFDFEVVHRTDVYAEQRGLEHMLYETYRAPLNKIRAINPYNPFRQTYLNAATKFLNQP